jgi:hypothetical protein
LAACDASPSGAEQLSGVAVDTKRGIGFKDLSKMHGQVDRWLASDRDLARITGQLFYSVDIDGTGYIERPELRSCLEDFCASLKLPMPSEAEVDQVLAELDTSEDGKLEVEEFQELVRTTLEHLRDTGEADRSTMAQPLELSEDEGGPADDEEIVPAVGTGKATTTTTKRSLPSHSRKGRGRAGRDQGSARFFASTAKVNSPRLPKLSAVQVRVWSSDSSPRLQPGARRLAPQDRHRPSSPLAYGNGVALRPTEAPVRHVAVPPPTRSPAFSRRNIQRRVAEQLQRQRPTSSDSGAAMKMSYTPPVRPISHGVKVHRFFLRSEKGMPSSVVLVGHRRQWRSSSLSSLSFVNY